MLIFISNLRVVFFRLDSRIGVAYVNFAIINRVAAICNAFSEL